MKFNHNRSKAFSWLLALAITFSALLSTSPRALADDFVDRKAWTTVGSAGTVDEADTGKLVFQGSAAAFPEILPPFPSKDVELNTQFALPAATTNATIRYNVTAVDGLFASGSHIGMTVRFRDDGSRAQVVLKLYEQDIFTGATSLLLTFDSNAFAASPSYQTGGVGAPYSAGPFNFDQKAYFIEATLTKASSHISIFGGRPGLAIIKLNRYYPIS
ncbi:MAG: hypothetical protein AB7U82_07985 [Blastocatellales bacterium]